MRFPLSAKLKDGLPIYLDFIYSNDINALYELFHVIVEERSSYPHTTPPLLEDFRDQWFRQATGVGAFLEGGETGRTLIGAFYLKPNWVGRARHVANAGFVVDPSWRNKGVGWLLGATMLAYAKELGYRAVIFNLVFAENRPALKLWEKLGFFQIGVIPQAVCLVPGMYQDAVIMFRSLVEDPPRQGRST